MSVWNNIRDSFIISAMHSPLGGGGLARAYYRAKGYSNDQINTAIDAQTKELEARHKGEHGFAHGATSLLGSILGGVDPTYAVGGGGTGIVSRAARMAAVQAPGSVLRQAANIGTGQQKHFDPKEVVNDMAAGAAFEGGTAAAGKLARLAKPYVKRAVNAVDEAVHGKYAPVAPDGMPGNASVRPVNPKRMAEIMNDPAAAGGGPGEPPAPSADVIPMPKRRVNGRDRGPADVLTDAELQELPPANQQYLDASAEKPVVDNTGYEAHTPYVEAPAAPANDLHDNEVHPTEIHDSELTPAEAQEMDASAPKPVVPDTYGEVPYEAPEAPVNDNGLEPVVPERPLGQRDQAAAAEAAQASNPDVARTHGPFEELHTDDPDGNKYLNYTTKAGDKLPIKMGIEPDGTAEIAIDQFGNGANKVGPAEIRQAMFHLQDMYPEIKKFGGYRRSGAGKGRVQEVAVPQRGADNSFNRAPSAQEHALEDTIVQLDDVIAKGGPEADRAAALQDKLMERSRSMREDRRVLHNENSPETPLDTAKREAIAAEDAYHQHFNAGDDFESHPMYANKNSKVYKEWNAKADELEAAKEEKSSVYDKAIQAAKQLMGDERGAVKVPKFLLKKKKTKLEDIPDEDLTPEERVQMGIRKAVPVLQEQTREMRIERNKRFMAAQKQRYTSDGEEGFHQELSKLAGDYKQFPSPYSIRPKLDQDEVRALFNKIRDHPMPYTDTIHARTALQKLLANSGEGVPSKSELEALRQVFPEAGEKKTDLGGWVTDAINAPRVIMASMDLSAPLRQGLPMIHRKEYWSSFAHMFKVISHTGFEELKDNIAKRPTYHSMVDSGLALSDIDNASLSHHEEKFMSKIAANIPVLGSIVRGSERAYVGFLNKLRADTFDSLVKDARAAGKDLSEKDLRGIANYINTATGRGDLNRLVPKIIRGEFDVNDAAPLLAGAFFSPRLMASRFAMINPIYYYKLPPVARKEAYKSLASTVAFTTTTLSLAHMAGLKVGYDPRQTDFGKIRVGHTTYDMTGGFASYIRFAAQFTMGERINPDGSKTAMPNRIKTIGSFLRNKEAPALSEAHSVLKGVNNNYEKVDLRKHKGQLAEDLGKDFVPLVAQDTYEVYKDASHNGRDVGKGLAKAGASAIPDLFGIGVNTYDPKKKTSRKTKFDTDFSKGFGSGFKGGF